MQQFRNEYKEVMELYDDNSQFLALLNILRGTEGTISMNRRLMQKIIDSSWVEAIEKGLIHVDNVLRNPRRTIEDVEEIVPIALSKKITVESVKHLAQHTDLIQSIDEKTGKITPSKILNVHKEESLMTYENKFVNTLIDRLYIFITMRHEKLALVAKDEEVFSLGFNTSVSDQHGGRMKIEVKIENAHNLETRDRSGYTIWQRVEKLKKAIEGYKGSELCKTLGNTFIRPPVMRTNAIMKNVDLKACLTLWQYIESYDKVGYEINIEDSAVVPNDDFIHDFYELVGLHMLLFRSSLDSEQEVMEVRQLEPVAPKIVKDFGNEFLTTFDATAEGVASYISMASAKMMTADVPENIDEIIEQIQCAIDIEQAYQEELRAKELEEQRLAEEMERRRLEEERIEAERQAEIERLEQQRIEEEKRIQELLEQRRLEQEEEERQREKMEAERLALLEKKRKQEEEEKARLEEERKQREAEEAAERERQRIALEKKQVISELGTAEGIKTQEPVPEEPAAAVVEETPAQIAARMKREQQQREKERAETERAQRLKAERKHFENKPFIQIRREYSRNPFWMLVRLIRYILAMVFGIIPEDTDRPDFKERRLMLQQKREAKQREKDERTKMEVYYKKYAQTFKYRTLRNIADYKFQRKRMKERKNKPRPVYKSKYTPEQQLEIQKQMRALYKEYHVSILEHIRRWFKLQQQRFTNWRAQFDDSDKKLFNRFAGILLSVFVVVSVCFSIYVTACTVMGKTVTVFGYSVLKVETGSMEPTLHVGDFIIVKSCDPSELKVRDIISFYSEDESIKGMLVTHRITEIRRDGTFVTKGDANPVSDSVTVSRDKILGVYVRKSGVYMWLGSFADTNKLFMLMVLIPLTLICLFEMRSVIKIGKQAHEELSEEDAEVEARKRYEKRMREAIEAEKKRLAEENYQPGDEEKEKDIPEAPDEDTAAEISEETYEVEEVPMENRSDNEEELSITEQTDEDTTRTLSGKADDDTSIIMYGNADDAIDSPLPEYAEIITDDMVISIDTENIDDETVRFIENNVCEVVYEEVDRE